MALWQLSTSALPQMDPIGGFKDGLVVGNFLQEKKAALAESVRKQQQRNTLADLLKTNTGADGHVNMGAVRYGMAQAGYGDQIPDMQKAWLDNDKTGSEISENTAEAGKNQQATRDAVRGNLLNMVRSANNPAVVGLVLNSAPARDAFSAEELQALMSGMPVDQGSVDYGQRFGQWQNGITQANTSPDTWMTQQTSLTNNALDNETQRRGQDVTAGTAQRGQDMTAATARRGQDLTAQTQNAQNLVQQQRLYMEQNKGTPERGNDGMAYIRFPDGRVARMLDANGQPARWDNSMDGGRTLAAEAKSAQVQTAAQIAESKLGAGKNSPQFEATRQKKLKAALELAKPLLNGSTHSYIGTGADHAARAFGWATDGSVNTSKLQTLSGQLVALMPHMEGPQSDKDVQMYQQMAGDLANPTLPVENRMAALSAIKELNQKYSEMAAAPQLGQIVTLAELKAAAKQAGVSLDQMIAIAKSQGAQIK